MKDEMLQTKYGDIKRSTVLEAKDATKLPHHLYMFAVRSAPGPIEFLKLVAEMRNWDAKELEAFYNKYPGLKLRADEELAKGEGFEE